MAPYKSNANADVDNPTDLGLKVFAGGILISRAQLARLMKFTQMLDIRPEVCIRLDQPIDHVPIQSDTFTLSTTE